MKKSVKAAVLFCGVALSAVSTIQAMAQGETASAASATVDEVIVTARKVTENMQDVPIPVSAFSADQLGIGRTIDAETISNVVPNVKVMKTVNNSNAYAIYIRGIGRDNGNINVEAPVAFYIDDVIYPHQVGPVLNVGGLERVEVLRGPQGTLYGRNATTGAVKYVTKRPDLHDVEGEGNIVIGSYDRAEITAGVSGPLAEGKLGARLDVGSMNYGGFTKDIRTGAMVGGVSSVGARASLLWAPSDTLQVFASLDGLRSRDEYVLPTNMMAAGTAGSGSGAQDGPQPIPRYGSPYNVNSHPGQPERNDLDVIGGNVQVTKDLDSLTLKSITSYRRFQQFFCLDVTARGTETDYLGQCYDTKDSTWTQEFQATGSAFDDRLKYVAGLFLLGGQWDLLAYAPRGNPVSTYGTSTVPLNYNTNKTLSTAAYLDVTYALTDALSVSAGVRVTKDEKEVTQSRYATGAAASADFRNIKGDAEWNNTTPRVGVDYKVNDDFLVFASWGRGFKGGSVNSIQPTNTGLAGLFVDPEETENTEVGFKSDWFGRRLRVNANYFWTTYTNQTTAISLPDLSTLLLVNDAAYEGFDLEVVARPLPQWSARLGVGSLNAWYENFASNPTIVGLLDKSPKHTPEWTVDFSTEYTFKDLPGIGGDLAVGGSYSYVTLTFECLNHIPTCQQEPYGLLNAHLAYTLPDDRFQVVFAGTNITGEEYFKIAASGGPSRYYSAPDEWSIALKARF